MARSRAALLRRLTQLAELAVQGTLVQVYVKCGTASCSCHNDRERRHGPHSYLKFRNPEGRPTALYIPHDHAELTQRAVEAWGELRETIASLSQLNREALRGRLRRRKGAAAGR